MRWIGFSLLFTLALHSSVTIAATWQTAPLSELVIYQQHSAPASVVAKQNSLLSTEVSGIVQAILVDVGDRVKRGDPLLQLDDFSYRQQYQQVEAAIEGLKARIKLAEFQLQQSQRLGKSNNISEERLHQRQTELATLTTELTAKQAQREQAQRYIDDCTVRAPFSGVVIERQAQLGELITPGTPILRLLDNQGQQLRADLHYQDAQQLHKSHELTFVMGKKEYPLQLHTLLPILHPQQRTQQARLDFVDTPALVGASGRLQWRDHRPSLPATYLQSRGGEMGIFILQQSEAVFTPLPGAQEGRAVNIDQLPLTTELVLDKTLPRQSAAN